jgi:hypothetical protein
MTLRRRIAQAATQIDREYPVVDQQPEVAAEERDADRWRRIQALLELCASGRATPEEQQRGRGLQYVLDRARARAMGLSS